MRGIRVLLIIGGGSLILLTLFIQLIHQSTPVYYLAYLADSSGTSELYLSDADGHHPQQSTFHVAPLGLCWFDWSGTGKQIFVRWDSIINFTCLNGVPNYGTLPLHGKTYASQKYSSSVRSPDDRWLIRTELDPISGYTKYIYRMDRAGNTKELLLELPPEGRVKLMWRGESVIFSQSNPLGRDFFRLNPFDKTLTPLKLPDHLAAVCENWSVSPDGINLYLLVMDERGWCSQYYRFNLISGDVERAQKFDHPLLDIVEWSPDGQTLAYWDILDDKLSLLSVETGATIPISDYHLFPHIEFAKGHWSPDSQWLAFTSLDMDDQHNGLRVYRIRADGTALEALTSYNQNSAHPQFSPIFLPQNFSWLNGLIGSVLLGLAFIIRRT